MTTTKASIRPTHWRGVDAESFPDQECKIDWVYVENIAEDMIEDGCPPKDVHIHLYRLLCSWAIEEREEGDMEGCAWYACHGIAALNYYQTPFENN